MEVELTAQPAQAAATSKSKLGLYEWTSVIGALVYLSMPLFILVPHILEVTTGITLTETHTANLRSLLTMVTPIAFIYLFGIWSRSISLLDMSLAWRLAWVGPWVVINFAKGALEVGPFLMIVSVDVGLPVIALAFDPRARGFIGRIRAHFKQPMVGLANQLLFIEGVIGTVAVFVTSVYLLIQPDHAYVESFAVAVTGCYFMFALWASRSQAPAIKSFVLALHVILIGALLLNNFYGFEGEARTNFAALAGFGLYVQGYTMLWERQVHGPANWSYTRWIVIGVIATIAVSSIWEVGGPYYGETCSQLAINIHRQDLIIGGFALMIAVILVDLSQRVPWQASVIGWLLPFSALWFTSATKLLCHFNVGTPLHPSWPARGLAPMWGGSHVMDFEFWAATMFMTAISTFFTSAVFILNVPTIGWRKLSLHGVAIILISALWMIASSSGLPAPLEQLNSAMAIPTFIPADPRLTVAVHVRDLIIGIFLMGAGPLLQRYAPESAKAAGYAVAVAWFLSIVPKIFVHMHMTMA